MAGNRSIQELNILKKYSYFRDMLNKRYQPNPPMSFTLEGKNGFQIQDVVKIEEDPAGDASAVDLNITTSSGTVYKVSCKQENPINFAGSGLKTFIETPIMRKWMDTVLGRVASFYISYINPYKDKMLEKIGNAIINDVKNNSNQNLLLPSTKKIIDTEYDKFISIEIPDVYIKISKEFRANIFTAAKNGGPITHYILNGSATNIMMNSKKKILKLTDCDIVTTAYMINAGINDLYIKIRKRRADQIIQIKNKSGIAVKDKNNFISIFSKSKSGDTSRRVEIKESTQLPEYLKKQIQINKKTITVPGKSVILEVPL